MQEPIDIYCERLDPGFWAEPLNALSNLAFFAAAFFFWRLVRRKGKATPAAALLTMLMVMIGAGSFLFHTLAVRWAMLADTIPILIFQITFLALYARDVLALGKGQLAALILSFLATIYIFGQFPADWFNGSLSYAPAFLFLTALAFIHYRKAGAERYGLLAASALFLVSLTFRSVDMKFCDDLPYGLHMIWHILNGAVLYLSARAWLLNAGRRG